MFTHLYVRYFEKSVLGIKLYRTSCAANVPTVANSSAATNADEKRLLFCPTRICASFSFVFRVTRQSSCCTFPGARVPPAARRPGSSPGRIHHRHARRESPTLADGFLPGMARSRLFGSAPPSESLLACSEDSWLGLLIS